MPMHIFPSGRNRVPRNPAPPPRTIYPTVEVDEGLGDYSLRLFPDSIGTGQSITGPDVSQVQYEYWGTMRVS